MRNGKALKFLIDTGANKNFVSEEISFNSKPVRSKFKIHSPAGQIPITRMVAGKFFKSLGIEKNLVFFVLPGLRSFDGIIGDDTLRELEAIIDRKNNVLHLLGDIQINLKAKVSRQVNNIKFIQHEEKDIEKLINENAKLFGAVSDCGIIETNVRAEIRTSTDEPIYTKSYPYPSHLRSEVETQVLKMIEDGIIRPSKSPYNSPLWIVEKKPKPNGEKQYRIVIDFKRLNAVTIADAYPIPEINSTLSNLGESKYFTTLDLTSGFHQIKMREKDIEKTAFSTNNGKFEFLRLPFGLKNAPAIFQRMMNDVLHPLLGKACYVYIDDIIVFGKDRIEHIENLKKVFYLLDKANLKINLEKSKFLKTSVEFLGHVVSQAGIQPDPAKIAAIKCIPPPKNLKDLKSFLGLASYYRRFIKDFAEVAKPLTNLTRGLNAQIKANQSKKIGITLDNKALKSFNDLKELLVSSEILIFPDFTKPFILTTDASNYAIGAVLSQGELGKDRPIIYLSRSLNKTEENYSTIEKEMLAIIWSLDKLRSYLYGAKELKILTDHQPLTFALSNANNNAKLKRWKARIEEYNYKLIYKPGKTNVVADALSRLPPEFNMLSSSDDNSQHSAEEDSTHLIPHCETPINVFRNQIIFSDKIGSNYYENPHKNFQRHYVKIGRLNKNKLTQILKEKLSPTVLNGIKIPEKNLVMLQEVYKENFSKFRIRITQRLVEDIRNEEQQLLIIQNEHKRAHRNSEENKNQILEKYYFPKMGKLIRDFTKSCETCNKNKYDRHPPNPELQPTPIPTYPTEILHVDIMEIQGEKFITCVDKFSKYAKFFRIKNKSVLHIRDKMIKLIHFFSAPRILVMDNEGSFISPIVLNYIEGLGIETYFAPPQKSEVNGTIERVHSTVIEMLRCLHEEYPDYTLKELVNITVDRYNNTVHSVTRKKPVDIFFGRTERINYQNLANFKEVVNNDLRKEIARNQKIQLYRQNAKKKKPKNYSSGDIVFKKNKQIKSKDKPLFVKQVVGKDNNVTITTTENKRIHKSHLKN